MHTLAGLGSPAGSSTVQKRWHNDLINLYNKFTVLQMLQFIFLLLLQIHAILANTEKTIFLGPSPLEIPVQHPTLEDLQLEALSPQQLSLRTHIQAEFPTNASKYGQPSWYLIRGLREGQRYEVRVCWAATVSVLDQQLRILSNSCSNPRPSALIPTSFRRYLKHLS